MNNELSGALDKALATVSDAVTSAMGQLVNIKRDSVQRIVTLEQQVDALTIQNTKLSDDIKTLKEPPKVKSPKKEK